MKYERQRGCSNRTSNDRRPLHRPKNAASHWLPTKLVRKARIHGSHSTAPWLTQSEEGEDCEYHDDQPDEVDETVHGTPPVVRILPYQKRAEAPKVPRRRRRGHKIAPLMPELLKFHQQRSSRPDRLFGRGGLRSGSRSRSHPIFRVNPATTTFRGTAAAKARCAGRTEGPGR